MPLPVQHTFAMLDLPENIAQQLYDLGVIDKSKMPGEMSTLNMFWAFGLANKNEILETGPMMENTPNYASTGGWTIAVGDPMDHYSMHPLITLTPEQQELVKKTSKNVFRPCCSNPAYFPDCNHGMAMLGILELLASQGKSEKELYATAKAVNNIWFPPEPTKGCSV
ncbi:MAG: hypothetical protein AAB420_02045 [Patescibacteria group bacterium]